MMMMILMFQQNFHFFTLKIIARYKLMYQNLIQNQITDIFVHKETNTTIIAIITIITITIMTTPETEITPTPHSTIAIMVIIGAPPSGITMDTLTTQTT